MLFIVVMLVVISPVFANSDLEDDEISVVFHDNIYNKDITLILPVGYGIDYNYIILFSNGIIPSSGKYNYLVVVSKSPIYIDFTSSLINLRVDDDYIYRTNFQTSSNILDLSSYSLSSSIFTQWENDFSSTSTIFDEICYSSHVIYDFYDRDNVVFDNEVISPVFKNPFFLTSDNDLCSGKFDTLKIDMGDMDYDDDIVILNIYDNFDMGDGVYPNYKRKTFLLDRSSPYRYVASLNVYYYIPQASLGIDIENDKRYTFELTSFDGETIYDTVTFEIGGLTLEEEIKNEQDEQTEAIKENTETNKGIWETIKDILSYINPFSENFFVYKLIELLVDAIKSLFIPSDDFFSTYFTNLQNWFSDRLGFLFYPFELIIDILNQILNINFSEPQFNIPDIYEPFTNKKLISSTTFNFNDLLDNSVLNTVHNNYLILVDVAIVFGLVNLFHRKYEEVTTK